VTSFVLIDRLGLLATGAVLVGLAGVVLLVSAVQMPRWEKILRASPKVGLGLIAVVAIPRQSTSVLECLQWTGVPVAEPLMQAVEDRSR
jgi:drug/metabolite transporter (DMT)-like permease